MKTEPRMALRSFTAEETIKKLQSGRVISQEEEKGAVRVKIVVSKQELRQMLASMNQRNNNHQMPSLEQLLHVLRKLRMNRAETAKAYRGDCWKPALQSIPEEI